LPTPAKPTAWATRTFIATASLPSTTKINACIDQVQQIAADAGNAQDMLNAQAQVTNLAATDALTYHYCFYQMVVHLDERLAVGGPVMTDLATTFFHSMRALWLFARGLDALTGQTAYFSYLQARYVQLSHDVFGRDVKVVGPPLGDLHSPLIAGPMNKPAGTVPAH